MWEICNLRILWLRKLLDLQLAFIETRMSNLVITELRKGTLFLSEIVELLTCSTKEKNSLKNDS